MTFGVVASSYPLAGTYEDEVLADSPMVYWKMDESSGSAALDSSGNGRDLSQVGVTWGATGLVGGGGTSADFTPASTSRMTIADAAWMDVTSVSVECWVNLDAVNSVRMLSSRYSSSTDHHALYVDSGKVLWGVWIGGSLKSVYGSSVSTGTTYHIVGTYDETSGDLILYINNSAVLSAVHTGGIQASNSPIQIGAHWITPSWAWLLDGRMGHYAMYDYALSPSRIAAHYSAGT